MIAMTNAIIHRYYITLYCDIFCTRDSEKHHLALQNSADMLPLNECMAVKICY